jgi:suppressor for copper-sensitivity B
MNAPKPLAGNNMACTFGIWSGRVWLAVLGLGLLGTTSFAQLNGSIAGLSGVDDPKADDKPVTTSASATIDPATGSGNLRITATINKGWHIYSVTQKPGGPLKTKIKLDPKADAELAGDPKAITKPDSHPEPAFNNLIVETHEDKAVWEVPIKLKPGVDPKTARITGAVNAQACAGSCLPPTNYTFTAKAVTKKMADGAAIDRKALPSSGDISSSSYRPENLHVTLRGYIEPNTVAPGSVTELVIEAEPDSDWHAYALADKPSSPIGPRPTLIVLSDTAGFRFTKPVASVEPVTKHMEGNELAQQVHETAVRWTIQLEIPLTTTPGQHSITGIIGLQTCRATECDGPQGIHFSGVITVGSATVPNSLPLRFSSGKYAEAERIASRESAEGTVGINLPPSTPNNAISQIEGYTVIPVTDASKNAPLPVMILFGVLGGLILNLMPCVLPVIGLKILGFAEQAGHSRARILSLNLWYAAGILAVFLILATLSMGAHLGIAEKNLDWGDQFQSTKFNIAMASVVFVMALSFLGVWEIPIPGFIGSGKTQKLASQEGASGAFAKGVMTTILATPCSGPFLGPVFALTLAQPPLVTYVIFTAIGVGMALPYLLIGVFPSLVAWLPKPGAWMETFKQLMGFVMLATLVYIFTFINRDYLVPTFALLIGLWAACWWIGRTPGYEPLSKRLVAWGQASMFAMLVGWFAFSQLGPPVQGRDELAWQPFTMAELQRQSREGKTVLVDFTANWCATCLTNLKFSINTAPVKKVVEANNVVVLKADKTEESPEIDELLHKLGYKTIPVLAAFPADRPGEVLVLTDLVSRGQVVNLLNRAGPSRDVSSSVARVTPNER